MKKVFAVLGVIVFILVACSQIYAVQKAESSSASDQSTVRIGLYTGVTGLVDALAVFIRSKVRKPEETTEAFRKEAKIKVVDIVQLGDTFSVLGRFTDRAYRGRPHLESMRQMLYAGRESGKLDWEAMNSQWLALQPFLVDLKATTDQEIDRISNPEVEKWVRGLRDAHLVYFAQIDTAVRAKQDARLLDLLGNLVRIFDDTVPAVYAFFAELRRDTERLREWSTTVGQSKGGPRTVADQEGDQILNLVRKGYTPPPLP